MANHRITYCPVGPVGLGRLSLVSAGESSAQARVRAIETREGLNRAFRVVREACSRDVAPETARASLLGVTGAGRFKARGPRDAGDRAAKIAARACDANARAADTQRDLRAQPGAVANETADAAMLPRSERRALRLAAFNRAKAAKLAAQAAPALPVSATVEGPIRDAGARDAGGCVPAWGADAFTAPRKQAR